MSKNSKISIGILRRQVSEMCRDINFNYYDCLLAKHKFYSCNKRTKYKEYQVVTGTLKKWDKILENLEEIEDLLEELQRDVIDFEIPNMRLEQRKCLWDKYKNADERKTYDNFLRIMRKYEKKCTSIEPLEDGE